ncbi:NAD(P)-dependent oxidoreductase [Actinomadura alba]|uniref:NAD(P)-dependent oxidoreductase n=1 Tax=Actinomadura alba TaxID=406431 RepID=A0ABR7LP25_9ACTN|nr:NAD(P)-binding domain-containing protein [Actinomadura alba]MBC6466428.1 NAD(P)-dependent oxidoreductase [Actinomadura alba]
MAGDDRRTVSVVGLGPMGTALAGAFLENGHPTTVWNRTASKAGDLVARGATHAATVSDAVSASTLVVVCVSVNEIVRKLLSSLDDDLSGKAIVNLTSGTPEEARETAVWAAEHGADYLDGAIMANPRHIGQLETMLLYSGSPVVFEAHEPTLSLLGGATHVGTDPGLASLFDAALGGLAWSTWSSFLHGAALVGTEDVKAMAFAPIAAQWLAAVAGIMADYARQVDDGHYPGDEETLEINAAAMDHLINASRAQGIGVDLPNFLKALTERAIAAGHGSDSFASVIEAIRTPSA